MSNILKEIDVEMERAWQIVKDIANAYYDSTDEAIEDCHQYFLNSERPEDICHGCNRRVADCICP
jgi:hypothetical protein